MAAPNKMLVHTKMDQQKFGGYQLMANPMNSHTSSTSLLMLFTLFQRFQIKIAELQNIIQKKNCSDNS
jgi:hypothetical protein